MGEPSVIELKPFYNEAQVSLDDNFVLRLVVNFRTIDRLEALLKIPLDEALGQLLTSTSMATKILWGMTREYHSDLSLDQIAGILFEHDRKNAVAAAMGDLVRRVFHIEGDGEDEKRRPPRKRAVGTSRSSAASGSRRASRQKTSGRKRRAAS